MTHRVERNKWILYRHTNNFDLVTAVAVNLKFFSKTSISNEDKKDLLLELKKLDYYNERNPELPLDSINHRINTLAYYMFGYKGKIDGVDRFLFSPLGNLFLKNIDNKKNISNIFLTMLWALQFQHPHGGSNSVFKLYPFRLIFKLLSEPRLDFKLYAFEVGYYVVFVEEINEQRYEKLVSDIIEMRCWSNEKIENEFKKDEHTYVNSIYEWDYYVTKLFLDAGVIEKKEGEIICKLIHGKDTPRKLTRNSVTISPTVSNLISKLEKEYTFLEKPLELNDSKRLKIDVVKEIYNFYPRFLLEEIGELINDKKLELLNLPKLIVQYSNNNEGKEAYVFEDVVVEGFNMFYNVEAEKIGGAGNTDVECLYLTENKKFAVDAKSTKNKLTGINSGRLGGHREKIGGQYTIVVTPRYVPAIFQDIKGTPIVIIRASTFSEYLYNCIDNDIRDIDYKDFDDIIINNLGKDISKNISDLTIARFATKN